MEGKNRNVIQGSDVWVGRDFHLGDKIIINSAQEPINIERLISLIDRQPQDATITDYCINNSIVSLLLHCEENQRPDLYIERLAYYRLGNLLRIDNQPREFIFYDFPLNYNGPQDLRKQINQALQIIHGDSQNHGKDIIDSLRSRQAGAVIFYSSLPPKLSSKEIERLILDHTHFWHNQRPYTTGQPLIAMLSIAYPAIESLLDKWTKGHLCNKMRACIHNLKDQAPELVVLPELQSIEKQDIDYWFNDPNFQQSTRVHEFKTPLQDRFTDIFKKYKYIALARIASTAHAVVRGYTNDRT